MRLRILYHLVEPLLNKQFGAAVLELLEILLGTLDDQEVRVLAGFGGLLEVVLGIDLVLLDEAQQHGLPVEQGNEEVSVAFVLLHQQVQRRQRPDSAHELLVHAKLICDGLL